MKKYMILSYSSPDLAPMKEEQHSDPDAMEAGMQPWFDWKDQYGDQVLDLGAPFIKTMNVQEDGSVKPSERGASGYMIIAAETEEEALEILKASPLFPSFGGSEIEIYEMMDVPM